MKWNYRVVEDKDGMLSVHEVYYDRAGEVEFITTEPITIIGEDVDSIKAQMAMIQDAWDKPVIKEENNGSRRK